MKRRLYFLFPDVEHTRVAADGLINVADVPHENIHVFGKHGDQVGRVPQPTQRQQKDMAARIEYLLWHGNLALFGIASVVLVGSLINGSTAWALAAAIVMAGTFLSGMFFTTRVPHVHIHHFKEAVEHGEMLMIIDVPKSRVKEVEDFIHHRYPEAVTGGTSWTIDAFGL